MQQIPTPESHDSCAPEYVDTVSVNAWQLSHVAYRFFCCDNNSIWFLLSRIVDDHRLFNLITLIKSLKIITIKKHRCFYQNYFYQFYCWLILTLYQKPLVSNIYRVYWHFVENSISFVKCHLNCLPVWLWLMKLKPFMKQKINCKQSNIITLKLFTSHLVLNSNRE